MPESWLSSIFSVRNFERLESLRRQRAASVIAAEVDGCHVAAAESHSIPCHLQTFWQ